MRAVGWRGLRAGWASHHAGLGWRQHRWRMQAADSAAAVVAAGAAGIAVVAARRTIPLRVRAGVAGARDGVPGVCHALAAGGRVGNGGTWRGRRAAP